MAELRSLKIQPAYRGEDRSAAAAYVKDDQAPRVKNYLLGTNGRLRVRGAAVGSVTLFTNSVTTPGIWVDSTGSNALWWAGEAGPNLSRATVPSGTAQSSVAVASDTYYPTGRGATLLNGVYGRGYNGDVLQWDGTTTVTAHTTNGPRGITASIGHLERLFTLGGSIPGTASPAYPKALCWTDIGGPATDTLAAWQDDYSGLVNQINLPIADGDVPVGLGQVGQNLAIFCANSIYVLYGQTPATFTVKRAVAGYGCVDADSIVSVDDVVWFMSNSGFARFDGVTVTVVSDDVGSVLESQLASGVASFTCAALTHEYILVAGPATTYTWLYHVPTGGWTEFTLPDNHPIHVAASAAGRPFAFDGYRIYDLSGVTRPTAYADRQGTGYSLVTTYLQTRAVEIAAPAEDSQLNRIHFRYRLITDGAADATSRFVALTYRADDSTLLATTQLPSVDSGGFDITTLQVVTVDCFAETHGVYFQFTANTDESGDPDITIFELNDIVLEYQVAKRKT